MIKFILSRLPQSAHNNIQNNFWMSKNDHFRLIQSAFWIEQIYLFSLILHKFTEILKTSLFCWPNQVEWNKFLQKIV